jgi:hypothetical protein
MRGRRETGIRIGRVYLARLRALLFFARMKLRTEGRVRLPPVRFLREPLPWLRTAGGLMTRTGVNRPGSAVVADDDGAEQQVV